MLIEHRHPWVYHMVPPSIVGPVLHPLNELCRIAPRAHDRQVRKYVGREGLRQCRLPILDCLWNDVLHFTPVEPERLAASLRRAGCAWTSRSWFAVDPVAAGFTAANCILYRPPEGMRESWDIEPGTCSPFDPTILDSLTDLPEATSRYYDRCAREGRSPLLFAFAPHVLFRGSLDTERSEAVTLVCA